MITGYACVTSPESRYGDSDCWESDSANMPLALAMTFQPLVTKNHLLQEV